MSGAGLSGTRTRGQDPTCPRMGTVRKRSGKFTCQLTAGTGAWTVPNRYPDKLKIRYRIRTCEKADLGQPSRAGRTNLFAKIGHSVKYSKKYKFLGQKWTKSYDRALFKDHENV